MSTFVQSSPQLASAVSLAAGRPIRIGEIAESRLRNSAYWAVRTVSCDYHDGMLILRGRVSAYYLKQVAQAAVAGLDGVLEIANQIEVVRSGSHLHHSSHDAAAAFTSRDTAGGGDRP